MENGFVINGPRDWNWRSFENTLRDDLEIEYKLPLSKNDKAPIQINESVSIHWCELEYPEHNSKIEYLHGPFWTVVDGIAMGTYQVIARDLGLVKADLKEKVAANRWRKEVAGTTATIQNIVVTVDTNRGDRDIFVQKYLLMSENETVEWKFPEGWLTLTKADLGIAVQAGATHVQAQFVWEAGKVQEIDLCTTAVELDAVDVGDPVRTGPPYFENNPGN